MHKLVSFVLIVLSIMLLIACEGPLESSDSTWKIVKTFDYNELSIDGNTNISIDDNGTIYFIGTTNSGSPLYKLSYHIYAYSNKVLATVYTISLDSDIYDIRLSNMDVYDGVIVCGGSADDWQNEERAHQFIVIYDNESWSEHIVPFDISNAGSIYNITAYKSANEAGCYFIASDKNGYNTELIRFTTTNGGTYEKVGFEGYGYGSEGLGRNDNTYYISKEDGKNSHIAFWTDDPSDYIVERIEKNWGNNMEFDNFNYANDGGLGYYYKDWCVPAGDGLAVFGKININEFQYQAVIMRDEAPIGSGAYCVKFFSPLSDDFTFISTGAFKNTNEGYIIGSNTIIRYSDGIWQKEDLPASEEELSNIVYGSSGYWALTGNGLAHSDL